MIPLSSILEWLRMGLSIAREAFNREPDLETEETEADIAKLETDLAGYEQMARELEALRRGD